MKNLPGEPCPYSYSRQKRIVKHLKWEDIIPSMNWPLRDRGGVVIVSSLEWVELTFLHFSISRVKKRKELSHGMRLNIQFIVQLKKKKTNQNYNVENVFFSIGS